MKFALDGVKTFLLRVWRVKNQERPCLHPDLEHGPPARYRDTRANAGITVVSCASQVVSRKQPDKVCTVGEPVVCA